MSTIYLIYPSNFPLVRPETALPYGLRNPREGNDDDDTRTVHAIGIYRIPVSHGSTLRLEALGERVDGRVGDVGRAHNVFGTVKDEDGDGEEYADLVNGGSGWMAGGRQGHDMTNGDQENELEKIKKTLKILLRCFTSSPYPESESGGAVLARSRMRRRALCSSSDHRAEQRSSLEYAIPATALRPCRAAVTCKLAATEAESSPSASFHEASFRTPVSSHSTDGRTVIAPSGEHSAGNAASDDSADDTRRLCSSVNLRPFSLDFACGNYNITSQLVSSLVKCGLLFLLPNFEGSKWKLSYHIMNS